MTLKVLCAALGLSALMLGGGAAGAAALDEEAEAAPGPAGTGAGGGAGGSGGAAGQPAAGPGPAPAAGAAASFDAAALSPYFGDGPLALAVARLRSGDAQGAAALIASAVTAPGAAGGGGDGAAGAALPADVRVRFLLAVAQLRTAQALREGPERTTLGRRAAEHFDALATSYPLLASYHALYATRAYLLAEQPKAALERAQRVPSDSVLDCDARALRGDALRAEAGAREKAKGPAREVGGLRERAVAAYRAYLAGCEASGRGARWQAQHRLAELYDQLKRPAEALLLWRRLYIEAPTELYGALAQRRLEQPGTRAAAFSPAELLTRAQVLFDEMRNPESEAAYRRILEEPDLDEAQRCVARYHLAQSVFKQRQRPRAAPLFDEAIAACGPAAAKNDDLHMKAMYQAARCHASAGELQKAADLFAQAEGAHPGHSYADDSRLRQAEMYQDLADKLVKEGPKVACQADTCPDYEAKLVALLSDLPERYPDGDRRAEALWRLALRALRRADLGAAQKWLDEGLRRIPREVGWDQEGRNLYWQGRVAELRGERAPALTSYRRTAQDYPLSFYTLLALNRVRAGFPEDYAKLVAELAGGPGGADAAPMTFRPRALFALPGFLRGIELLRLGLGAEAKREFSAVGITVPESKSFRIGASAGAGNGGPDRAEQEELLWLASVLYDRAGAWHLSHFIPRHLLTDWQRRYPVGEARKQWLLAYPRGYLELLTQAARDNGHPEALQLAIVREESAFDPLTESFANAIGLTQMIPPTAKRFSEGLPYDREALRDPKINVAIGARFLGFLWRTMAGNPALTISSYNAGENAVFRWLRGFAELKEPWQKEIDVFIEAIPYDETRGYTKRVLSSYLTYSWLYAGSPAAPAAPATTAPATTAPAPLTPAALGELRVPRLPFVLPPPPARR